MCALFEEFPDAYTYGVSLKSVEICTFCGLWIDFGLIFLQHFWMCAHFEGFHGAYTYGVSLESIANCTFCGFWIDCGSIFLLLNVCTFCTISRYIPTVLLPKVSRIVVFTSECVHISKDFPVYISTVFLYKALTVVLFVDFGSILGSYFYSTSECMYILYGLPMHIPTVPIYRILDRFWVHIYTPLLDVHTFWTISRWIYQRCFFQKCRTLYLSRVYVAGRDVHQCVPWTIYHPVTITHVEATYKRKHELDISERRRVQ